MLVHSDGLFVPAELRHGMAFFQKSELVALARITESDGHAQLLGGRLDGQRIFVKDCKGHVDALLFVRFQRPVLRAAKSRIPIVFAHDIQVELCHGTFCISEPSEGPFFLGRVRQNLLADIQRVLHCVGERRSDYYSMVLEYDENERKRRMFRNLSSIIRYPYADIDCPPGRVCFSTDEAWKEPDNDLKGAILDYVGSRNSCLPLDYITEIPAKPNYLAYRRFWAVTSVYADYFE